MSQPPNMPPPNTLPPHNPQSSAPQNHQTHTPQPDAYPPYIPSNLPNLYTYLPASYGQPPANYYNPPSYPYATNPPAASTANGGNPAPANDFATAHMHPAYPYAPAPYAIPAYTYPPPAYPVPTYPSSAHHHTPYPYVPYLYPYPYPLGVEAMEVERDNEINSHGYRESEDYPKDQARKERLRARIVFFAVIALLLIFFFTPLLSYIVPSDIGDFGAMLITFAFEIVLIVVFSLVLRRAFPRNWKDALALRKPRGINLLIGAGSGLGALGAASMLAAIVILLGGDLTDNSQLDSYMDMPDWQLVVVLFVFIPLCAPFFEELLFRGVLVGAAVRAFPGKIGFFVAIIGTGLVFGSLHFPGTFDVLGAFVVVLISGLGMFLAWLRLRTNSALVTMATHAVYNGTIVILQIILVSTDAVETIAFL